MFVPVGTEEPVRRRRFPAVTLLLVALNSLAFLYELYVLMAGGDQALNDLITRYGVLPAVLTGPVVFSLHIYVSPFTAMFLHAGFAHILFNMVFLASFGDNVEDRLGHFRYLLFYLLSGLAATAAQVAVDPSSPIPSIGASGAIAGVLSGYLLLFPTGIVRMLLLLGPFARIARVPAFLFILFWFFTQFLSGLASLGVATTETGVVAYWAHIGGFAAGLVFAILLRGAARARGAELAR